MGDHFMTGTAEYSYCSCGATFSNDPEGATKHVRTALPPRRGTVLVFKPGTTVEQAEEALAKIADVIDASYYLGGKPVINSFESVEHGGPVWYIP